MKQFVNRIICFFRGHNKVIEPHETDHQFFTIANNQVIGYTVEVKTRCKRCGQTFGRPKMINPIPPPQIVIIKVKPDNGKSEYLPPPSIKPYSEKEHETFMANARESIDSFRINVGRIGRDGKY